MIHAAEGFNMTNNIMFGPPLEEKITVQSQKFLSDIDDNRL